MTTKQKMILTSTLPSKNQSTPMNTTLTPYRQFFHDIHMAEALFWFIFTISILGGLILLIVSCHYIKKIRAIRKRFRRFPIPENDLMKLLGQSEDYGSFMNGRLDVAFKYLVKKEKLVIKIVRADNLPTPIDGSIDSYVIVTCNEQTFTTKTKRNQKSPIFNEKISIKLNKSYLLDTEIYIRIMDYDEFGEDALLAQKKFKLNEYPNLDIINQYYELSLSMDEGEDMGMGMGQICVILNNTGHDGLRVTILEAKSLRFKASNFYKSVYIIIKFKSRIMTHKNFYRTFLRKETKKVKLSKEPYFNETFLFKYDGKYNLCESQLKIEIHKSSSIGSSVCLGYVLLGGSFLTKQSSGQIHWDAMLDNPRQAIPRWHVLTNPNI